MNQLDWEFVIGRHLDGIATAEEVKALSAKLESDAQVRLLYLRLAEIHARLATGEIATPRDGTTEEQLRDLVVQLESSSKRRHRQWNVLTGVNGHGLLTVAVVVIAVLSLGLVYQLMYSGQRDPGASNIVPHHSIADAPIARITGLSGSLIWTGDRGQMVRDLKVGRELAGGTIEGVAPDSWFELQFNDGSTVMISGTSMLTFADAEQKELRLKEGIFSANVAPQPEGKPMLIHTPSTVLEVLGTQFDVEANMVSTVLNVTEGKVRVRRLSDGREIDVPARHRVVAEGDGDLTLRSIPESVNHWKSQLHQRPGSYGKWLPATQDRAAAQKAIPFIPSEHPAVTLYLSGVPVSRNDGRPVVVRSDSHFIVRGRLNNPAKVYFGIAVSDLNGDFAGKFRLDLDSDQPFSEPDSDGNFEVAYRLSDFTLDPCVRNREDELAVSPDDLVLNCIWAFTNTGSPSGLEINDVELTTSNKEEK